MITCQDHGIKRSTGANTARARRRTMRLQPAARDITTRTPMAAAATAKSGHRPGTPATTMDTSNAVPAARRTVPDGELIRIIERTAKGRAMAAIDVPMRPLEIAPLTAGSSA